MLDTPNIKIQENIDSHDSYLKYVCWIFFNIIIFKYLIIKLFWKE